MTRPPDTPDDPGAVPAPLHPREPERLAALHALQVLDGPADAQFDRLTTLAASLFGVPTALISLVDEDRQWFLSRCGLEAAETPRDLAFCAHALHERTMLIVEDARADARFATNPLVTGAPFVRFYAGVVLRDRDELPLGTLCLISPEARAFTRADRDLLARLGEIVAGELLPDATSEDRRAGTGGDRRTDALTGALPAGRFTCHVDHLLQLAGPDRTVAGVVSVPELERINGIFGTEVGDALLRVLAGRLSALVGRYRGGAVGRLGGRRLAFCAIDGADAFDPDALVAACEASLRSPFALADRVLTPDLQAGLAIADASSDDAGTLLARCRTVIAGQSANRGLQVGRHDACEQAAVRRRSRIAAELGGALARDALHLVCQPKYACGSGELTGFECLLRWQHPELGHIPPPEVLEAAADVNLMPELDRWVADRALSEVARWRAADLAPGVVSINVTGATLLSEGFTHWLSERLDHHGVPAAAIELELLESSVFDDFDPVIARLHELRQLGVGLSLDDFGTGYSSLSYLRLLPVSVLKIDRSFVFRLDTDPTDVALCVGILGIAHSLGLSVVAEGVENERQLEILRSHGCDAVQGYHLCRPLPLDEATRMLETRRCAALPRAA